MSQRKLVSLMAALALAVAACTTTPAEGYDQLADIDGIEQLAAEFNVQEGSPRLILLLSPT